MNSSIIQLLVLAGIAVFLILRLGRVLGTRDPFQEPPRNAPPPLPSAREPQGSGEEAAGPDLDITDHVGENTPSARALAAMKRAEPSFSVGDFLGGARGAYEMILMQFEKGDLASVEALLDKEVRDSFYDVIARREDEGLSIEAEFLGVHEVTLTAAVYDEKTGTAEVTVRFVGELLSVVRDSKGDVVEGDPKKAARQKDVWTFARRMGSDDPNWKLIATAE